MTDEGDITFISRKGIEDMLKSHIQNLKFRRSADERIDLMIGRVSNAIRFAYNEKAQPYSAEDYHLMSLLFKASDIARDYSVPMEDRIEQVRTLLAPTLRKPK